MDRRGWQRFPSLRCLPIFPGRAPRYFIFIFIFKTQTGAHFENENLSGASMTADGDALGNAAKLTSDIWPNADHAIAWGNAPGKQTQSNFWPKAIFTPSTARRFHDGRRGAAQHYEYGL
jgi:hypothetical protein